MNKKGITRKIYALFLSLLCLISAVTVYAEDNQEEQTVNPFNVSATEPDYEGKFTLNINISKNCVVEAFKISVEYDDAMVSVSQDTSAYGNYSSFLEKYNSNGRGICLNNHIYDSRKVIFTGAQPDEGEAALSENDKVAYLRLQCILEDKTFDEILKSISVKVENCSDGNEDLVKTNPEIFASSMEIKPGDTSQGEEYLAGDIDFSGKVDLTDASTSLKAALGIISLDEKATIAADVDKNGKVDLTDTILTLKLALGIG